MTITLTGTVVNGAIQFDEPLNLPNHTCVTIQTQPLEDWRERMQRGLDGWRKFRDENPTGSHGERFSREQLYEDT